eukprot:1158122-Pelagomonas_calceolata.AAC.17
MHEVTHTSPKSLSPRLQACFPALKRAHRKPCGLSPRLLPQWPHCMQRQQQQVRTSVSGMNLMYCPIKCFASSSKSDTPTAADQDKRVRHEPDVLPYQTFCQLKQIRHTNSSRLGQACQA